ncbi:acyl-homoserine lactone acylase PvdQ [Streptosporangium becharense]|uniref:Acyl-homoserine lactone acylase PvdQ n=1 Tax=Streptosporangium becharense TaxID=1816182 RepID=A0A7W9IMZ6_9ACTN|nr:penicillin acylase family protein [Streptosporangium becharense]MBB2910568.1 acyl-homoserine lactone acylase PvdQ [Streptosporangium becharense]MBB5823311.1 acyl-homoserine lactone acylase PvdQ [Streptosporangium becharense]
MSSQGTVRVERDEWGVAYVSAAEERDLFFGLGYAQASDLLHELLGQYKLVRGELSSVLGEAALERDAEALRWGYLAQARADYARASPAMRARYAAFVAGIDRYLRDHPGEVPAWAPPLEPALPIAAMRALVQYWVTADGRAVLAAAGIGSAPVVERGSNAWALLPQRTADGVTYLLSDPHLPLGGLFEEFVPPPAWIAAAMPRGGFAGHEVVARADELSITGVVSAGTLLPLIGHGAHCAWGLTTGGPAVSDAYRIRVEPHDELAWRCDGELRRIDRRSEWITVAGRAEPLELVVETVELNGTRTPVIARADGCAYAVSTTYAEHLWRLDEQLLAMYRARDIDELKAAFEPCVFLPQNVVAADVHGDAWYVRAGHAPRRSAHLDRGVPLDAGDAASAWQGRHTLEELVQHRGSETGFLQSCNTAPDTLTGPHPRPAIDLTAYPPVLVNDRPGRSNTRGDRAVELLANTFDARLADAVAIALDDLWPETAAWQRALSQALRTTPPDVADRPFARLLLAFDGRAHAASPGALGWLLWRELVRELQAEPGEGAALTAAVLAGEALTPAREELLRRALAAAAERMRGTPHGLGTALGEVLRFGEAAGGGAAFLAHRPVAGQDLPLVAPLRVAMYSDIDPGSGRARAYFGGPSLRLTRLGPDGVRSWSAISPDRRESGAHSADQAHVFAGGELRALAPADAPPRTLEAELTATAALDVD